MARVTKYEPPRSRWASFGTAAIGTFITLWVASYFRVRSDLDFCGESILIFVLLAFLDSQLIRADWSATRRRTYCGGLIGGVALLMVSGNALLARLAADDVFIEVFGMAPPNGITGLQATRYYAGVFDADGLTLQFKANRAAVERITWNGLVANDLDVLRYRNGEISWEKFWATEFGADATDYGMSIPPAIAQPLLFERSMHEPNGTLVIGSVRLVRNPATGDTWVARHGDLLNLSVPPLSPATQNAPTTTPSAKADPTG